MLVLLSPSKTLDDRIPLPQADFTQPHFLTQAKTINATLRKLKATDLQKLQSISPKLAELNADRNQNFSTPFTKANARPALYTFKGDVYDNMQVTKYTAKQVAFAQQHVRILSGLYGVLRPLDLMQPYRLEMGTSLPVSSHKNLYQFWGESITRRLNDEEKDVVVNLASTEYFSAVQPKALKARLIQVDLKQEKDGKLKTIGLMAKRARGLMADWIVREGITDAAKLKNFSEGGYRFRDDLSKGDNLVFSLKM